MLNRLSPCLWRGYRLLDHPPTVLAWVLPRLPLPVPFAGGRGRSRGAWSKAEAAYRSAPRNRPTTGFYTRSVIIGVSANPH